MVKIAGFFFSQLSPSLYRVLRQSIGSSEVIERNLIEMLVIKKCYYPVKVSEGLKPRGIDDYCG